MKKIRRQLDLQAKISLVLFAVIVPMFVVATIAQNKLTQPILEDEVRQIGIKSGQALAAEILSSRLLSLANPTPAVENDIQELLYSQPNIIRIDVAAKDPLTRTLRQVGTNVEDDPTSPPPVFSMVETVTSEFKYDDSKMGYWDINVPIEHKSRDPRGPKRILGLVHVQISTKFVGRIVSTLWHTTATAAAFSVVTLILLLGYFLRKTLTNDRLLKIAESQNLQLAEQLHDAERQLMNMEKLAVMGQLTASFAHEIGTPLNALGGHLQLLREEVQDGSGGKSGGFSGRFEVIDGQLSKIAGIVKGFLQSTAKPNSQTQLVDLNRLADRTLGIVGPRIDALGVEVRRNLDRTIGPLRVVPLDLEQILLNLLNNSLDSLKAKSDAKLKGRLLLEVKTGTYQENGREWAEISVHDTGEGIKKIDLGNVTKPFFTTKRPGEGTGLGLTICQQLAHKYGGELVIDSKEGTWTRVGLRIPYQSSG